MSQENIKKEVSEKGMSDAEKMAEILKDEIAGKTKTVDDLRKSKRHHEELLEQNMEKMKDDNLDPEEAESIKEEIALSEEIIEAIGLVLKEIGSRVDIDDGGLLEK